MDIVLSEKLLYRYSISGTLQYLWASLPGCLLACYKGDKNGKDKNNKRGFSRLSNLISDTGTLPQAQPRQISPRPSAQQKNSVSHSFTGRGSLMANMILSVMGALAKFVCVLVRDHSIIEGNL